MSLHTILYLLFCGCALGGTLNIYSPNFGDAGPVVQKIGDPDQNFFTEWKEIQDGQVLLHRFTDLRDGEYRVYYQSFANPLGFIEVYMETNVELSEKEEQNVFLYRPSKRSEDTDFPKEVKAFLDGHKENYLELTYKGHSTQAEFTQVRLNYHSIWYLKKGCTYHVRVWDHKCTEFPEVRKVIFDRTFEAITPTPWHEK